MDIEDFIYDFERIIMKLLPPFLILFMLFVLVMGVKQGCRQDSPTIIVIDGCEYIQWHNEPTIHKANCTNTIHNR